MFICDDNRTVNEFLDLITHLKNFSDASSLSLLKGIFFQVRKSLGLKLLLRLII